ncbi:response regulator [Aquibacillus albus]|uniref:Two-component system response regulator (Stage 0 sporulation protein F) n=1 Tax=Aquibacillus albus TaxID=1168171 RepID=A0ABS2MZN4_9BACI|nr:response regulator [Aquibacillus albus]MBM7571253.1 two-component system response regulator (stage 0 sporulation protein F) [Aquibacillus albus]
MNKTVMIVDDQLGIRLLLEEIIKNEGHQVISAENAKEALDLLEDSNPDLLLVDYKLPIMDGHALLKHLEEQGKIIPTILMSGLADEAAKKTEGCQLVKEVFAKPFNIEDARKQINQLLEE